MIFFYSIIVKKHLHYSTVDGTYFTPKPFATLFIASELTWEGLQRMERPNRWAGGP